MKQRTFKISVNGMQNLGNLLRTAGWAASSNVSGLEIFNANATSVFLHLNGSGTAPAGGTETDGIEIGNTAAQKEREFTGIEINNAWIYAGAAVDVKFLVQGY